MSNAGFKRGTNAQEDTRFSDKKKKLKTMLFGEGLDRKVDMNKVDVDSLKPWIAQRLTDLLGMKDDVVVEFVYNQLEERYPDAKCMQINLTGFLNGNNARTFLSELWDHLCSAQENVTGIPNQFLEQKKNEITQGQAEQERIKEAEQLTLDRIEAEKLELNMKAAKLNESSHTDPEVKEESKPVVEQSGDAPVSEPALVAQVNQEAEDPSEVKKS